MFDKKNIYCFLFLWILFVIVLSSLSFISWTLLTGFLLGSILAITSYFVNIFVFGNWMSRRKTFKWMFFLSFLKFIVWIICFSAIFIGVLYANKNIGTNIKKTNEWIDGVFNIFLFIVGSSIIMISIIFYHIVESIMNKKKKNIKKGGKIYD